VLGVAKDLLLNQDRRREYDAQRPRLQREGKLTPSDLGEEFSQNAYGGDSSDSSSDDEEDDPPPMSEEKQGKLNAMEPFIKKVLESDDEEARQRLKGLCDEMEQLNIRENDARSSRGEPMIISSDRVPPYRSILKAGERRREKVAILQDTNQSAAAKKKAKDKLKKLQHDFRILLKYHNLPLSWTYDVSDIPGPSPAPQQSRAGNTQTSNPPAATGTPVSSSSDAMDTRYDWTPGETERGEKILAHRSITTRCILSTGETGKVCSNIRFVIELDGDPTLMDIVERDRVGIDAMQAYMALPDFETKEIAYVDNKYRQKGSQGFQKIVSVKRDPYSTATGALPWTILRIEYKVVKREGDRMITSSEYRIINRTALRLLLGDKHADAKINEWLIDHGQRSDSTKEERRRMRHLQLLDHYDFDGRPDYGGTRSQRGPQQMLGNEEDLSYDFEAPSFPRGARMPVTGERVSSRGSRQNQFGNRNIHDTHNGRYQPTSAHRQEPMPAQTDPPIQPPLQTRATNTLPNLQRQMSAAADGQYSDTSLSDIAAMLSTLNLRMTRQEEQLRTLQPQIPA